MIYAINGRLISQLGLIAFVHPDDVRYNKLAFQDFLVEKEKPYSQYLLTNCVSFTFTKIFKRDPKIGVWAGVRPPTPQFSGTIYRIWHLPE